MIASFNLDFRFMSTWTKVLAMKAPWLVSPTSNTSWEETVPTVPKTMAGGGLMNKVTVGHEIDSKVGRSRNSWQSSLTFDHAVLRGLARYKSPQASTVPCLAFDCCTSRDRGQAYLINNGPQCWGSPHSEHRLPAPSSKLYQI